MIATTQEYIKCGKVNGEQMFKKKKEYLKKKEKCHFLQMLLFRNMLV